MSNDGCDEDVVSSTRQLANIISISSGRAVHKQQSRGDCLIRKKARCTADAVSDFGTCVPNSTN